MGQVIPRQPIRALIEPHYPKAGNGLQPMPMERMLRIYFRLRSVTRARGEPVPCGQAPAGLRQGPASGPGQEHGAAVHHVRAGAPVPGQAAPVATAGDVSVLIANRERGGDNAAKPPRAGHDALEQRPDVMNILESAAVHPPVRSFPGMRHAPAD
jgi:hypothetical protein